MSQARSFEEITLTEAQREAFLERMRAVATAEDYRKIEDMSYRLARLQKSLGVPLPESTQWELMKPLSQQAQPILEHLIAQGANSPLVYQDDTTMRILDHGLSLRSGLSNSSQPGGF